MTIFEILLLSIGLAMDAFAVSICKGATFKKDIYKKAIIVGIWFGLFQSIMPSIGYLFGMTFSGFVIKIDHWIAFFLLLFLGINMAYQSFSNDEDYNDDVNFSGMFILAVATSIDALAVGITFSFFNINIYLALIIIGVVSFVLSCIGVIIGNMFEKKLKNKAEMLGGIVLIFLAFKILFEHLGIM